MKIVSSDSHGITVRLTRTDLDDLIYVLGDGCEQLDSISSDEMADADTRRSARRMMLRGERLETFFRECLAWVCGGFQNIKEDPRKVGAK